MRYLIPRLHRYLSFLLCGILILGFPLPAGAAENTQDTQIIGGEESGLVNILLIGQDRRKEDDPARADCIILCSLFPEEKEIIVTSFLRDLYVDIPGHQPNRLNAAYAFGGMELMQQTMEENFCLQIDGCIEADFSHFPEIIDALGGVSIELRQDEAEAINESVPGNLTEGTHLLTGKQALAYSRIRNLDADGDFSRTARQRRLIFSLLDRYRSASFLTVLSSVADIMPMVTTNFSKKQILILTAKLFPLLDSPEISSHRVPGSDNCSSQTIRGMEVLTADMEILRHTLRKLLLPINAICP